MNTEVILLIIAWIVLFLVRPYVHPYTIWLIMALVLLGTSIIVLFSGEGDE